MSEEPLYRRCKLANILNLGMVNFVEDIEDIAGGSDKELQIETNLHKIIAIWDDMQFAFSNFKNRGPVIPQTRE